MLKKRVAFLLCLVVAPILSACQDSLSPQVVAAQIEADALSSLGRRTLRSQLADGKDLTILGETHAIIGGRALRMPPEVASLVQNALRLQTDVDNTVSRMRTTWEENGYRDIDEAVGERVREFRSLNKVARGLAIELAANETSTRLDVHPATAAVSSTPSCNDRAIDIYERSVEYRTHSAMAQSMAVGAFECIMTAPIQASVTYDGSGNPQLNYNSCAQEIFNSVLMDTIVRYDQFVLNEMAAAYWTYCG